MCSTGVRDLDCHSSKTGVRISLGPQEKRPYSIKRSTHGFDPCSSSSSLDRATRESNGSGL